MRNLDTVNAAFLSALEEGMLYAVLTVRNLKSGAVFVSVRSQSPKAFVTGLKANSKSPDFGAYKSQILTSVRRFGQNAHEIKLVSMHKTQKQARLAKKLLVETLALKPEPKLLSYNRPVKGLPESDFRWLSPEEIKEKQAKRRARKATPAATTAAVEASA